MFETADVIVVGAGVQGASLAFHLARRGASVLVLERESVAAGATGRSSGEIRTFPVAILEADGRQFLFSPFGEVNWVHNLRATGEATIQRGRRRQRVQAFELAPDVAAPYLEAGLRPVLGAPVFGSMICGWYGIDRSSTAADYRAAAHRHPAFDLRPAD